MVAEYGSEHNGPPWSSSLRRNLFERVEAGNFYRQGWGLLMRTPVGGADDITPGVAQQLLDIDFHDSAGSSFVVSPDGRRVLVNKPVEGSHLDETPITLVTGWATEVARLAGPGRAPE